MALSYTQIPDYNQFVQSYFVDQELLDIQDVGTVLVQSTNIQSSTMSSTQDGSSGTAGQGSGSQPLPQGSVYGS